MLIAHDNSWSWVTDYTTAEIEWLDDYLSVPYERYVVGEGSVEERYRMLSSIGHRFASGLFAAVVAAAARGEAPGVVAMDDRRGPPPCAVDLGVDLGWLRDYQLAAVWACTASGRGVVKSPTGSGKTEILVALTKALPTEWLLLTHRIDLVQQIADRYRLRTGETAGTFERGEWRAGTCNLTVATFQGIYKALRDSRRAPGLVRLVEATRGLLVDEVHGQAASTYYRVTQAFGNAYYRFGFSGTPLHRGDVDALKTIGAMGPIVYQITYDELVRVGVLARPHVRMVRCAQPAGKQAPWDAVYSLLVVRSARRNQAVADCVERAALPCLVFVDHLAHGAYVLARLAASGFRVAFVHGKAAPDERRRRVRELADGDLDVLICTVIFQEGIDVPALRSVVVAGGKASAVACLQRVGRGMRKAPGKDDFEVWDILDEGQEWLERHAQNRAQTLRDEGLSVEIIDQF